MVISKDWSILGNMHTLSLNMKEDIEFQRELIVKLLSWKIFLSLRIELYSSICILEINTSRCQ
jgi:hypothetical protein